jgi:hypothetical protein
MQLQLAEVKHFYVSFSPALPAPWRALAPIAPEAPASRLGVVSAHETAVSRPHAPAVPSGHKLLPRGQTLLCVLFLGVAVPWPSMLSATLASSHPYPRPPCRPPILPATLPATHDPGQPSHRPSTLPASRWPANPPVGPAQRGLGSRRRL